MAELFNTRTRAFEDVADADVVSLFQAGTHGFRQDEKIPVIAPDGAFGTIPSESASEAFRSGFVYDVGRQDRADRIEFKDRDIAAFLTGGARGATLGLSDPILESLGIFDERELEGIQEFNPAASIAGEIAGTALPLLIPEPTSSAGAVARLSALAVRTVGAPVRAVARAGRAASQAVEGAARALNIQNPALRYAGEKIAARLAEGGTEGALFEGGRAISELALEDPEILAEQTLAEMGLNVLTRAGEGAAFGAVTAGVVGTGIDALSASRKLTGPAFRFLQRRIEQATNRETLRSFAATQAARSLGGTKRQRELIEQRLGQKVFSDDELDHIGGFEVMGRDLRNEGLVGGPERILTVERSLDAIDTRLSSLGKEIEDTYSTLDAVARSRTAGQDTVEGLALLTRQGAQGNRLPRTAEFSAFLRREVLDPLGKKPLMSGPHRRLSDALDGWIANQAGNPRITFDELWKIRRELDDTINWRVLEARDYNGEARNFRDAIRRFTLDEAEKTMAGVELGFVDRFKELNRLYSSLSLAKSAAESGVAAGLSNSQVSLRDMMMFGFTGAISMSFMSGLGAAAISKFVFRERGNAIASVVADRIADLGILGVINKAANFKMDGIVDSLVSGVGVPRSLITAPAVGIATLLDAAPENDSEGIARFGGDPTDQSDPDAADAYRSMVAEIDRIEANPERLTSRLADFADEGTDLTNSAPNTYSSLIQTSMRAIQFLSGRAARPPSVPNLFAPEWSPTRLQMESFGQNVRAVNDPFSVLAELTSGFPSNEGVQTLQAVYPALLNALMQQLMESFSLSDQRPSYGVRVNLSRLLGSPLDPATSPVFFRQMQELSAPQEGGAEEAPQAPVGSPLSLSPVGQRIKSQNISERATERLTASTETNVGRVTNT